LNEESSGGLKVGVKINGEKMTITDRGGFQPCAAVVEKGKDRVLGAGLFCPLFRIKKIKRAHREAGKNLVKWRKRGHLTEKARRGGEPDALWV